MQNWISPLGGSTEGSFLPKAKGPYECYKKFQVLSNFTVLHQDFREKERRKKGNRLSVGNKERSYPTTPFLHSPTSKHCGISYGRLRSHSHGFVCAFKENTTKVTFDKAVFSSFYPSMWKKKRPACKPAISKWSDVFRVKCAFNLLRIFGQRMRDNKNSTLYGWEWWLCKGL